MRYFDAFTLTGWSIFFGLVAITFSNSVGGFCARAGIAFPLYLIGVLSEESVNSFVLMYGPDL